MDGQSGQAQPGKARRGLKERRGIWAVGGSPWPGRGQPGAAAGTTLASGEQYMRERTTKAESTVSPPMAASAADSPKASASTPVSSAPTA